MKSFIKTIALVLTAIMLGGLFFCACDNSAKPSDKTDEKPNTDSVDFSKGTHHIVITVQGYGKIYAELYSDIAPITVQHFVKLAKEGYYDGLTFHRIISGFMIQGGSKDGTGYSRGDEETIKGEFSANGVNNTLSHDRGVLSYARTSAGYDTGSTQFFIMHQKNISLDGQYAAFGKVTEGIEIVDEICADTPVQDGNGTVLAKDQPVITSIVVVD